MYSQQKVLLQISIRMSISSGFYDYYIDSV